MNNLKFVCIIFLLTPCFMEAQIGFLEQKLFKDRIPIEFKVDSSEFRCEAQHFDNSLLKSSTKFIVETDTIISELKKIAFNHKYQDELNLKEIYNRFAIEYDSCWGKIYTNICLLDEVRAEAKSQFRILLAFETTLRALSLRDNSSDEIWTEILSEFDFSQNILYNPHKFKDLIDQVPNYSEVYKELISKARYAGSIGYRFFDPYLEGLETHFIKELSNCSCPIDSTCNIAFLKQHNYTIASFVDLRIPESFIKNQECLNENQSYYWLPIVYLEKQHNPSLLQVVLNQLFSESPKGHILYKLFHIYRNELNHSIFNSILKEEIKKGNKTAIKFKRRLSFR